MCDQQKLRIRRECQSAGLRRDIHRSADGGIGQRHHIDPVGREVRDVKNSAGLIESNVRRLAADGRDRAERSPRQRAARRNY
jgi:hypothetical protein